MKNNTGEVSDGYHTFDELYEHRHVLFMALMSQNKDISWMAERHDDGSFFEGWFVAGVNLPTGVVTYHLPDRLRDVIENLGIPVYRDAPKWDGHTSSDVVTRISKWIRKNGE